MMTTSDLTIFIAVVFGMVAGGPIWRLVLPILRRRRLKRMRAEIDQWQWQDCRPQWRVVDSTAKRLGRCE